MNKPFEFKKALKIAGLGVTFVALATSAQALDKLRWKVPNAFPSHLPALGENAEVVANMLDTMSGGQIKFKIFEPGNLVPALEATDAVGAGAIDAAYSWPGYDAGKIPVSPLLGAAPFGMQPWEYTTWWYEAGGKALGEAVYAKKNVMPLLCGINGPETAGWYSKEINSVEDLKGLKIRFAGLGGQVLQKLGASVTLLPGGELFQALEKGAIEATEFSMPAVDNLLGFYKVAKNNYFPGWHQTYTAFYLLVNLDKWNALGDDTKAMFHTACTATTLRSLTNGEAIQSAVLAEAQKNGVSIRTLDKDILAKFKEVTDEVLDEQAEADADFKSILDSQRAFVADYAIWKDVGYYRVD